MNFSRQQIDAVLNWELAPCIEMSNLGEDGLHDLAWDLLVNDAPEVWSAEAEMDEGPFSVIVRGVRGAYFVQAMEFDDEGVFDTIDQAIQAAGLHFGEFFNVVPED